MENIEQLKLDNEKLNARLNKAVEVFKEQKAQIETLTKEKEEANKKIEELNAQCNEYELKLQEAEKKLEERLQNLRAVENTTNEELKKVTTARDEWIDKYHKLEEQFKEQEKFESEVINIKVPELENKLNESIRKQANYEGKCKELEQLNIEKENKIQELSNSIKMQQDNVVKLSNDVKAYQVKLNDEHLLAEEYKKQIQEIKDDLTNKNNILIKELEETKINREEFRSQLTDLEKEYDKLNKLYDDCEAEKLSAQADCEQLQEKIKNIEVNNISDKEWQNHLENVLEQIRNLADDIVNPKPAQKEIRENIMKRTGDYNVSGNNIGV